MWIASECFVGGWQQYEVTRNGGIGTVVEEGNVLGVVQPGGWQQ